MVPGLPSLSCEISRGCSNKGLGGPITIIANGCRPPRPGETWDLIILFNRVSGGLGGLDERRSQEAFRILVRGRPQVATKHVRARDGFLAIPAADEARLRGAVVGVGLQFPAGIPRGEG